MIQDPNDRPLSDRVRDIFNREEPVPLVAELSSGYEVELYASFQDGNDPMQASTRLPIVPRKGDTVSVWNTRGGYPSGGRWSGSQEHLSVEQVILHTSGDVDVWVSTDGYKPSELRDIFEAAREPGDGGESYLGAPYAPGDEPTARAADVIAAAIGEPVGTRALGERIVEALEADDLAIVESIDA